MASAALPHTWRALRESRAVQFQGSTIGPRLATFRSALDLSLECAGLQQLFDFFFFCLLVSFFSPLTLLPAEFLLTLGNNTDISTTQQCNLRNAAGQEERRPWSLSGVVPPHVFPWTAGPLSECQGNQSN